MKKNLRFLLVPWLIAIPLSPIFALNNGVALTPPMGWSSWNANRVNISDALIRATADAMVSSGMKAVGYSYVNIDDGWGYGRNASGVVYCRTDRFPNGMKPVADYIHSLGLKAGIYTDIGPYTCGTMFDGENIGSYGVNGHYTQDATTYFVDWGFDFLKVDVCSGPPAGVERQAQYTALGQAIVATGKPGFYNVCTWDVGFPGAWVVPVANSWRINSDIQPNYTSIMSNADRLLGLVQYHGPGHWNDPDMMQVGNGMSAAEDRTHFSLWCMLASPLIAGNDIRNMSTQTKDILTNGEAIAVDQDSLGIPAVRSRNGDLQVYWKPMRDSSRAVLLLNRGSGISNISFFLADVGLLPGTRTRVRDLWGHIEKGFTTSTYTASVNSHDVVMLQLFPGPDLLPPAIVSASANTDLTHVLVAFSEPLEQSSAVNIANYTMNHGAAISSAALSSDKKNVTLTTSVMIQDTTYTLTVNRISDLEQPPKTITSPVSASFRPLGITKIRYYPRPQWSNRMVGGIFQGTNGDKISGPYTTLVTIITQPPEGQWTEITSFTCPDIGYRTIRYLSPNSGWGNVSEIEFYRGANKATGVAFGTYGSYQNSGNDYTKAFDGNVGTFFDCANSDSVYVGLELTAITTSVTTNNRLPDNVAAPHMASIKKSSGTIAIFIFGQVPVTTAKVLSIDGRFIRTLYTESPGKFFWDGRDATGMSVPQGIYLVTDGKNAMRVGNFKR